MIFALFSYQGSIETGIVSIDKTAVTPFRVLFADQGFAAPKDINTLIENYDTFCPVIERLLKEKNYSSIPLKDIKLKSPIPYPKRNVICLGKNYADHVKEIKGFTGGPSDIPDHPIYFTKAAYPCIGPEDTILRHKNATRKIDYEVELGVIIGKKGINIPAHEAESYIFGYTVGNDISARDLQKQHVNWFKGKSLKTHCSIGPWIVHKTLIPFPICLNIQSRINGELRQDSNTKNLIFDIPNIISDLSKGMELIPGDIILTGTPSGVGLGFDPPKYLQPGDKIECSVEKIGTLTNYLEE